MTDKTTDLVSRLRQFHAECVASDNGESGQMAMMRQAAEEIERLRTTLRNLKEFLSKPEWGTYDYIGRIGSLFRHSGIAPRNRERIANR